jgi:hypothetical protein
VARVTVKVARDTPQVIAPVLLKSWRSWFIRQAQGTPLPARSARRWRVLTQMIRLLCFVLLGQRGNPMLTTAFFGSNS